MPKLEYINTVATSRAARIRFRINGQEHHLEMDLTKPDSVHSSRQSSVEYPRAEALVQDLERLLTELETSNSLESIYEKLGKSPLDGH